MICFYEELIILFFLFTSSLYAQTKLKMGVQIGTYAKACRGFNMLDSCTVAGC